MPDGDLTEQELINEINRKLLLARIGRAPKRANVQLTEAIELLAELAKRIKKPAVKLGASTIARIEEGI